MGKPFASEIQALPDNLRFAENLNVGHLREELNSCRLGRILSCGAGGSFSAAVFAQLLIREDGGCGEAITPLQFLQSARPNEPTTIILFSASGKNKDVLQVIRHAGDIGVKVLLICAASRSPAATLASKNPVNRVFSFSYPAKKDGFLAVNSLAVTWWLLARAFGHSVPRAEIIKDAINCEFDLEYIQSDRRHACLILHDTYTKPVAIDLESKLAEAGLCAPIISDWRQFGHGRHHWLAKNELFSSILALKSSTSDPLSKRTLSLLPPNVPKTTISSDLQNIEAVCELLIQSFAFVSALGRQVNIDPGRPGVPQFGSKLYRLGTPLKVYNFPRKTSLEYGCLRKRDELRINGASFHSLIEAAGEQYKTRLLNEKFDAVVLDFDGTLAESGTLPSEVLEDELKSILSELLANDVTVGIATGRGDSCHQNLFNSIPEHLWKGIAVCHYNGASVGMLDNYAAEGISWEKNEVLLDVLDYLSKDAILKEILELKFKDVQITLKPQKIEEWPTAEKYIRALISTSFSHSVKLVASSHTLDIVPVSSSKRLIAEFLSTNRNCHNILAIGDRGDLWGNDFELLSSTLSLSVDRVSPDLNRCWNFLPLDVRCIQGTAHYLRRSKITRNSFKIREI